MLGLRLAIRIGKDIIDVMGRLLSSVARRATYSENLTKSRSIISKINDYNILDKASILLTPTAYSDARVHSVKTYTGDELVTNGGFDTDSDWTLDTGWSIEDGVVKGDDASFDFITQSISGLRDKTIKVTFEIKDWVGGTFRVPPADRADGLDERYSGNGTYQVIYTSNLDLFRFQQQAFDGSIDNVSVVDVSSDFDFDRASSATRINSDGLVQDMQSITDPELVLNGDFEELSSEYITNGDFSDGETGWTKGGAASSTQSVVDGALVMYAGSASDANNSLSRTNTPQGYNGKTYKLELTVSDMLVSSVGFIRLDSTYDASNIISFGTGTSTIYFTAYRDFTHIRFFAGSAEDGYTIDNVSVQQVDPNDRWTVLSSDADNYVEFTEGFARLKFLNTSPITTLSSTLVLEANKTYELVVDVHDVTSGAIKIDAAGLSELFNAEGVTTRYLKPTGNTTLSFYRATADVDITFASVSVKDITFSEDVDLARINYDSNGENGHWLLEPTSTNEITYSEDLSQWTSNDVTVTDNNAISPDGTQNASKIELDSGTSIKRISLSSMPTSSVNRSFSVFIKANSDFTGAVQLVHSGDLQGFANFDLSDGTVGSTGSKTTANIVSYANDWYRCTAIFDSTNTFASTVYLWVQDNDSGSYGGSTSATGSIFAYGFQYEALSHSTSYIPTYGSTVTRATETLTGSGNSTLINSTEGVLYAEIAALADDGTTRRISLNDGTTTNRIIFQYSATSGVINYYYVNSTNQCSLTYTISDTTNFSKIALKWKQDDFALWVDGVERDADNSGNVITANTLNALDFDATQDLYFFYGKVKALAVFDEALTDDELELLTGITNYGSFNELAQANGYTII